MQPWRAGGPSAGRKEPKRCYLYVRTGATLVSGPNSGWAGHAPGRCGPVHHEPRSVVYNPASEATRAGNFHDREHVQVITDIQPCREAVTALRREGLSVGLVPTMGALHEGHLSLIRAAKARCDRVALTIFVNPAQFGPGEDLSAYPRPLEADLTACRSAGVDLVFTPSTEAMYPHGAATSVHVDGLTDVLCGPFRPGHFDGVATVVSKLFHILPADAAFFGEKDYQQLIVIKRMVADLRIPIEIVGCPTVRAADGMAISTRNAYLSAEDRKQAARLSHALFTAVEQIARGEHEVASIVATIRERLGGAASLQIEYVDVVDEATLEILTTIDRSARICAAVRIASCRLIDNVGVDVSSARG